MSTPKFDSAPSRFTGTALHVHPMPEQSYDPRELYVGISYPVTEGGRKFDRTVTVVLSAADRKRLAEYLADIDYAEPGGHEAEPGYGPAFGDDSTDYGYEYTPG